MTTLHATIRHHSISRAPVIDCGHDLKAAKAQASRHFGSGFHGHVISIFACEDGVAPYEVAYRVINKKRWVNV